MVAVGYVVMIHIEIKLAESNLYPKSDGCLLKCRSVGLAVLMSLLINIHRCTA